MSLALVAAALLAATVPSLLAFNLSPSVTLLNQLAGLVGWAAVAAVIALQYPPRHGWRAALASAGGKSLLLALAILVLYALAPPLWTGQPWALARSNGGMLLAALVLALAGLSAGASGRAPAVISAVAIGWLVAGLLSVAIGIVQVFLPAWADGDWIARSGFVGRAVGNLRQPNHLSSLLLWSLVGTAWLMQSRQLGRVLAGAAAVLLVGGIVLSASRTGIVGVLLLAVWGIADRRLRGPLRIGLLATPVVYVLVWLALAAWAHRTGHVFGAESRMTADGDLSSSRFGIWSNTSWLIAHHPWAGVGFGEFNLAWSLTPFPHRPVAFFDHTHNIVLQLAVEIGVPAAIVVLSLLAFALWRAFRAGGQRVSSDPAGLGPDARRAAFMAVLMMVLHSQLEYPLWYAYFLLPTALAFGLCLGRSSPLRGVTSSGTAGADGRLFALSLAVMVSAALVLFDYRSVVGIFAPDEDAKPLAERIEAGQRSWFFSHHADYAAATSGDGGSAATLAALAGASHYLLDTRLMIAWAKALNAQGDTDRARHIAQRLREFRNPDAAGFFAPCDEPVSAKPATKATPRPFQCDAPNQRYDYRDFR